MYIDIQTQIYSLWWKLQWVHTPPAEYVVALEFALVHMYNIFFLIFIVNTLFAQFSVGTELFLKKRHEGVAEQR